MENEEMNLGEKVEQLAKENQTLKIIALLEKCKDLDEAIEKVKALLEK